MIYSFSHRTDGPAFYWPWFMERVRAGYARIRNPYYPDKVSTYDLTPEVCEGFTFTSKNFAPVVDGVERRRFLMSLVDKYPTTWAATITPYGRDLEPRVPDWRDAVETVRTLSGIVGAKRVRWMYSPVAMYDGRYGWAEHLAFVEAMAQALEGAVTRMSLDTLKVYEKVSANAPFLREPHKWEEELIVKHTVAVCAEHGIEVSACPAQHRWRHLDVDMSPCMSTERFAEINDLTARKLKFREGSGLYEECVEGCAPVRDLAPYNSCPHDCLYCYANAHPGVGADRHKAYDMTSDMLLDGLDGTELVSCAKPRMYFKKK